MHPSLSLLLLASAFSASLALQPFLYNAPTAKRAEFERLLEAAYGLPRYEVDKKVAEWVSQQSPAIKLEWANFQMRMREAQASHEARLARFSPAARRVDATLTKIADDPRLTPEDKGYLIHQLIAGLPANVRAEIENALQATRPDFQ